MCVCVCVCGHLILRSDFRRREGGVGGWEGKGGGDLEMSECQDKEKEKLSKLLLSSVHNKVNSHNNTMGGHLITF